MVAPTDITFLGTGSAQPSATRNHQAIALRHNGEIWMFDVGEATQHQLQKSDLKMGRITKVFITHMHGDHCFGLPPLLCTMTDNLNANAPQADKEPIDVFGPSTLRRWLRTSLKLTRSRLGRKYRVHELLLDGDEPDTTTDFHDDELPGNDFNLENGHFTLTVGQDSKWHVRATEIKHSIPSLGYILREPDIPGNIDVSTVVPLIKKNEEALKAQGYKQPMSILSQLQRSATPIVLPDGATLDPPAKRPGREIVILGDTCDASSIIPLCNKPDLLVHEATNALTKLDTAKLKAGTTQPTFEQVEQRAREHGHSTPQMAADLARRIGAKKLILTHFSVRYKGDNSEESLEIMESIRQLAIQSFGPGRDNDVYCAQDLWSYEIKLDSKK